MVNEEGIGSHGFGEYTPLDTAAAKGDLKPDIFVAECVKDLVSMNVKRKPPAIYYACPVCNQVAGASWGSTADCLITTTGLTILDTLDTNMDELLHINRVSIVDKKFTTGSIIN